MRVHQFLADDERYGFIFEAITVNDKLDTVGEQARRTLTKLQDKFEAIGVHAGEPRKDLGGVQFFKASPKPRALVLEDNEHELMVQAVEGFPVMAFAARKKERALSWLKTAVAVNADKAVRLAEKYEAGEDGTQANQPAAPAKGRTSGKGTGGAVAGKIAPKE